MRPPAGVPPRKKDALRAVLKRSGRLLVAFSGGKDSYFLARQAAQALAAGAVAVCHVRTRLGGGLAAERLAFFASRLGQPLRLVRLDLLADPRLRDNPRNRCYLCKRLMFAALKREAKRLGLAAVADGSTRSDRSEHRPGRRALQELGVLSPLRDAGITSAEIAAELQREGVPADCTESTTCLATRFPYGERLELKRMRALDRVERFLSARGVHPLRARHIPGGVRIEADPGHWQALLAMKDELCAFCRKRGFLFVTLDLGGLRSGPWDRKKS